MPAPRHDSFSISQDGKLSQDLHDHVSPSNVLGVQDNIARTSSFSKKKLMRGPEAEPRDFVYVYDYSENKTRRMKTETLLQQLEDQNIDNTPIPYALGSIPICTGNDGANGGETVVARVHINMALRLQRWLGMQKRLYIVDAFKA